MSNEGRWWQGVREKIRWNSNLLTVPLQHSDSTKTTATHQTSTIQTETHTIRRAPYCHLWSIRLYHNFFSHYLMNGAIFGKRLLNTKCVFWFSLQLLSETFLIIRRIKRDIVINVHWSSCKVPVILVKIGMKREISLHIFEKYKNIKFHENPSSGSRVVPCGGNDGKTWRG